MDVAEFDFDLPSALIAQTPAARREDARLLVVDRASGTFSHGGVSDLPGYLAAGEVLVLNNTRVFPARLLGVRVPSGGAVECLLLAQLGGERWDALVHPGQKLRPGARMEFRAGARSVYGEVVEWRFHGRRTVRLWTDDGSDVERAIDTIGHVPLPPYIHRADCDEDRERYQTVYASERGSVAAPTAGLHFTPALLEALDAAQIDVCFITLHVGYGTFKPVRVDRVEDHQVDAERFTVGEQAASAVNRALIDGRRIVAVGTTTTRALESSARVGGGRVQPGSAWTDLFIHPGFPFRIIGGLLTNFHLPRSSLLMLVSAFGGRDLILRAYAEAVRLEYRFYSYGDAMLVL